MTPLLALLLTSQSVATLSRIVVVSSADMAATPATLGPVEIFWSVPSCSGCAGDTFTVERSATSGGPYTPVEAVTIQGVPDGAMLVGFTPDQTASGTLYYVIASSAGVSNEMSATVDSSNPAPPSGLTISVQ